MTGIYLGLDLGTSGLKILVVDGAGDVLARGSVGYDSHYREPGVAEQDPRAWILALTDGLSRIDPDIRRRVTAVGATGHVPSLVAIDVDGMPVRPTITWQDTRAGAAATALAEKFGSSRADLGTDLPWSPSQVLPKLAWLAAHEPATVERTRWILTPKDFVNAFLTGVTQTDPWSSKGVCDVTGVPATRLLEGAGWTEAVCPPARPPWEMMGMLLPEVATRLGLAAGIPVATGWTDALGAMLAVGTFDSPRAFVLTGTSNIVGVSRLKVSEVDGLYAVPAGPSAPLPLVYGPTQSGGEALSWGARLLGIDVPELIRLAATVDPETAPTFVPYLRGERAPLWNTDARALLTGLGVEHGRPEIARGIVDGVARSARHVLDLAGASDGAVEVGGVGAADPIRAEMWATALGRPVRTHAEPNLSALGAAMLAARAAGSDAADISGLRRPPTEFPAPALQPVDRAFRNYLDASRVADEWSQRA